jgi:hypothetical protein
MQVFNGNAISEIGDSIYFTFPIENHFWGYQGLIVSSTKGIFKVQFNNNNIDTIIPIDTTEKYFTYDYVRLECEGMGYQFIAISKTKMVTADACWGSVKEKEIQSELLKTYISNQTLNIEIPSGKAVDIALYDMLGNMVWTKTNQTILGNTQYEINNLQSGIYVVNVKTKDGQLSKKVVLNGN